VAPDAASTGQAVERLLDRIAFPGGVPGYVGGDHPDEEAFEAIRRRGGDPTGVGSRFPPAGRRVTLVEHVVA
jgi:hypothetical protein